MRQMMYACVCMICGEDGVNPHGYRLWGGAQFKHKDANVCVENLERAKQKEEQKRRELSEGYVGCLEAAGMI